MIENILYTILGVVLSTIASISSAIYISYRKYDKGPNLTGKWFSEYQSTYHIDKRWVRNSIEFKKRWGKLHFKTANNEQGILDVSIEGYAEPIGRDHIIGEWAQSDGSSNYGVFILTIIPTGRYMVGLWMGADESGEKRYCRWIHARDEKDLQEAKNRLDDILSNLKYESIDKKTA